MQNLAYGRTSLASQVPHFTSLGGGPVGQVGHVRAGSWRRPGSTTSGVRRLPLSPAQHREWATHDTTSHMHRLQHHTHHLLSRTAAQWPSSRPPTPRARSQSVSRTRDVLTAGDAILTAPGAVGEVEEVITNGVKQRVWKNVSSCSYGADAATDQLPRRARGRVPQVL